MINFFYHKSESSNYCLQFDNRDNFSIYWHKLPFCAKYKKRFWCGLYNAVLRRRFHHNALFFTFVISKLLSIWDSVGVRSKSRPTWDKSQSLGLPRIFMKTKDWLIWKGFLRLKGWRSSFLWFEDIKTKLICNVFHQISEAQDWRFKICFHLLGGPSFRLSIWLFASKLAKPLRFMFS